MRKITGDPLADYPELAELLVPRITDWRENRACLCGCGATTSINLGGSAKGFPGYFKRGHHNNIMREAGLKMSIQSLRGERSPGAREYRNRQCVTTLGLSEELREYCRENEITLLSFAQQSGIPASYLYEIRNRTRKRVTKTNLVKIMEAMGRTAHSSLLDGKRERECAWCGTSFVAYKHAKTCSDKCRRAKNDWEQNGGRSAADLELAREYGV